MELAADYEASFRDLKVKPKHEIQQFKTSKSIFSWLCLELDSEEASKDIIAQFDVKEIDLKALEPAAKSAIRCRRKFGSG